jgi:AraC family transcriptional regulator, ethanolamine operon transcriptional activator
MPDLRASIAKPAVTVVEITDPTATRAGIELLDQDAVRLQSTPFRMRRVIVRLEGAAVVFHSANARVRTRTISHMALLAYVAFGPRAGGTVNGLPIRANLMLAVAPKTEVGFVAEAGYESIAFLLPPEDVREHLRTRHREGDFRLPRGVEALQVNTEAVHALYGWGKRLIDTAAQEPALFNNRKEERVAAHFELIETLLATLGSATGFAPARGDLTREARSLVVKTAEDYALSHPGDRLFVSDLCRVAGVSERALEYAFKDVMGLSPVVYLIRLRLHRVRQALLQAAKGSTTVSAEALNWGFWHFGEFSRAYRECFGELPSDTLRRKSEPAARN